MDFKQNLCAALSNACGMTAEQIGDMLETPPNPAMGDFALPCFKLAKTFRKAPPAIAAELARNLGEIEGFSRIETAGGYLNCGRGTLREELQWRGERVELVAASARAGRTAMRNRLVEGG